MRLLGVLVAVMLTCYCAPVLAVTITSDSGFNGPTVLVDFSQFVVTTNGPSLQVGNLIGEDVVLSERNGFNSVVMNGIQGLSDNGQWDTGRNGFVSAFATTNLSHEFTFNGGLISEFGFVFFVTTAMALLAAPSYRGNHRAECWWIPIGRFGSNRCTRTAQHFCC